MDRLCARTHTFGNGARTAGRRAGYVAAALLVAVMVAPLAPGDAQGGGWQTPVVLEEKIGWWPALTIDPFGGVHIIWSAGQDANLRDDDFPVDVVAYRYKGTDGWTDTNDVQAADVIGYTVRNGITATADGMIHLVYRAFTEIYYSKAPMQDASDAASWSRPQPMSSGGAAYYTDIASDARGVLHAIWGGQTVSATATTEDEVGCPSCADVYYRRSVDGGETWTAPVNLSNSEWGSGKARIHADDADNVYVTWDEGVDWLSSYGDPQSIAIVISHDGGQTWGEPRYFGPAEGDDNIPQQVTFGKDGRGNLVLAYHVVLNRALDKDDHHLYYQVSRNGGETWSDRQAIPGAVSRVGQDTGLDDYDMAADPDGHLHLVYAGARNAEDALASGVYHVEWDGASWSEPEEIYYTPDYCEWTRISVDAGGGMHVVWHERPRDQIFYSPQIRTIRIMYAERPGAPWPEPTLMPTITPRSSITPALPTPTITRTPPPTYVTPVGVYGGTSRDASASATVLIAAVPVLFLIGMVLLMRGFRIGGRR